MVRVAIVLLVLMLLPTSAQAQAGKRFALLIGNQGYNAKVGPLKNPHIDIALIGAALKSLGFRVTEVRDGDYRSIDVAIKRHVQSVRREGQGTISFLYYSGHGAADPDTKINYLIPVDVPNADDEDLWNRSLNLNTLVERLRAQAPEATHYVVFDACRNELNLTRKGQKALADKGFVPISYTPGVMVAYATAPGRTASDIGERGGTYARALADEIVKPGVDSMLVFTRVARRVNREINQDPFMSASTMPEIYFAGDAALRPPPSLPSPQPDKTEIERAASFIRETEDQARLETFIKQFGDSPYADMARARLQELKRKQVAVATPPKAHSGASTAPGGGWQGPQSAWVKLCERPTSPTTASFGKATQVGKRKCLTDHERLDGKSAAIHIAVAVREIEGQGTKQFTAMVPLGVHREAGMRGHFYPRDLWEKVQQGKTIEKSDEARLKLLTMSYAFCNTTGCTAEMDASLVLINDLRSYAGLLLFTLDPNKKPTAYPISLVGFREAHEGAPVDNARYHAAKKALIQQIHDRQR